MLSPEELEQIAALDEALDEIVQCDRLALTAITQKAHRLEDEPNAPVEEPKLLEALLEA